MRHLPLALVVLFALPLVGCQPKPLASNAPWVEAEPLALDFGPVPVGLTVTLPVILKNVGKYELVVAAHTNSALSNYAWEEAALNIGPGERATVHVSFTPSVAGARDEVLHLANNSENSPDLTLPITGQGTPRLVCGDCTTPPADYCASSGTLITWQPHGTCVMSKCEYQAATVYCGGVCAAPPAMCTQVDGGSSVTPDAGAKDAGVPDAGAVDAGAADAGAADAGVPDAGPVDAGQPDAGPAVDAGTVFPTPGSYTFVVPTGVTQLTIKAWGGGGAGGNQTTATGGAGAFVRATVAVTPGESLEVQVAEGGVAPGNGAGASSVLRGVDDLVVAAGGGGAGSDGCTGCTANASGRGGAGGGVMGQHGADFGATIGAFCTSATGGAGGTATAGGVGGTSAGNASSPKCTGQQGAAHVGGRATGVNNACDTTAGASAWHQGGGQGNGGGGGGGAGRFGGGGAGFIWTYCAGGGGGGSSFATPSATQVTMLDGVDQLQGNVAESAGAGAGGNRFVNASSGADGHAGRVVLTY